jgi:hypothetical protein
MNSFDVVLFYDCITNYYSHTQVEVSTAISNGDELEYERSH